MTKLEEKSSPKGRGTKIIVTLGPATKNREDLLILKAKGVDFVRINMSHSTIEDLRYFLKLAKEVGLPFVVDTEGSQVRTGPISGESLFLTEGSKFNLTSDLIEGTKHAISLKPSNVVSELSIGDILHVDFHALALRVIDVSHSTQGYVTVEAITSGLLGSNKGVVIDPSFPRDFTLPCLTPKDYEAIDVGISEGVEYVAASFMRSKEFVDKVRAASQGKMKIISKIECVDALENLDEIIDASDFLLIDRGDLSKEIPLERIPLTQKIIINRARQKKVGVFVATNLLETMVEKTNPTRAEIQDVINTIIDGATGLALSAETAIGKHPHAATTMLLRLIGHMDRVKECNEVVNNSEFVQNLEKNHYLYDYKLSTALIAPHGGKLIERYFKNAELIDFSNLPSVVVGENIAMDVEQIATGAFSPLEGFMDKKTLSSVLDTMRLPNGVAWTLPIILDVSDGEANKMEIGQTVVLSENNGIPLALLHLEEKFKFDPIIIANKLYGTTSENHPGVCYVRGLKPVFLAGKIELLNRRKSEFSEYALTPRQMRRLFVERGWSRVVGFHTRNVIHRSHEYIQLKALEESGCDGMLVHPVVGKKKQGDYNAKHIIRSYELMMQKFYPKNRVLFGTFNTYSRYAGPREAIFTAICRKNFGCSHFIVGRDHTGVGEFYSPTASHEIFDEFPDLGIVPILFNQIFYSLKTKEYIHEKNDVHFPESDKMYISGTQARKMFEKGEELPEWFMRPEISQLIIASLKSGEEVFFKD